MNTTNTTTINTISKERAEGMRRMATKYGVPITKVFLGVVDAVDAWWLAENADDADTTVAKAKERMDGAFELLNTLGWNEMYDEFLDTEEYDMVAMPGID